MELFKLRVENLGRIADAELSIRPLTVFVGPNNTNKTWTAYSLFALAKWMSGGASNLWLGQTGNAERFIAVDHELQQVITSRVSEVLSTVAKAAEDEMVHLQIARAEVLKDLSYPVRVLLGADGIAEVLRAPRRQTSNAKAYFEISETQFSRGLADRSALRLPKRVGQMFGITNTNEWGQIFYRSGTQVIPSLHERAMEDVPTESLQRLLFSQFHDVRVFPAERKSLVTTFDLFQPAYVNSLSLPVIQFVRLVQDSRVMAGVEEGEPVATLSGARVLLEERVMQGRVDYQTGNTKLPLAFNDLDGRRLTMQSASSLVRALAGLDLYLKYLGHPDDLIVIDEPEMNAHPEAQLMITELLGVLVNAGINVVITTHSPYVADHVSNLVEAAHLPQSKQEEVASRFALGTKEAFVPAEKVSVYLFNEDGRVEDVFDREERNIDLSTFGKASDRLDNLFSDVLEAARRE